MIEFNFSKNIINNGLRLIEVPKAKTGAVSVLVAIKAGSRFEELKVWGIAHFLEHMFFKGGKRYKNAKEVASAIDKVGGIFNAFTDKEEVGFFVKLPGEKIEIALDILSDMLTNSRFLESDIKKEANVVIEEMNMYEDSPMFQTTELLESILYKNSSLGRKIIGQKETIKKIKRGDFLNYTEKFYKPENIVIVIAGDTSSLSKELVSKLFKFSSLRKSIKSPKLKEYQKKPEVKNKFKETNQSNFSLGFRMPEATFSHKDFFASRVLSVILGEGMSSRIFLEIREKKGLAYRVSSSVQSFTDAGYIEVSAGTPNDKIKEALSATLLQFRKLKEKKVSKEELNKAKEYLKGKLTLSLEDSLETALFVSKQELLTFKILPILEIFQKIESVSAEDIQRLANNDFKNNKLNLAVIGPFKSEDSFLKILKI